MRILQDWNRRIGLALVVLTFSVYYATASRTIDFWDSGEFVATAYTLGIPHQPGTPLYVLVGRVFTVLAAGLPVAFAVNLMSSFFASMACLFVYLTGVRLQRDWAEEREDPSPPWLVYTGAATGTLFLAFSHTFWTNAIEAEVYSIAAFTLAFAAYLSVRWYERRDLASSATIMLIIVYLMGLSIGFHMGSILVYPGVVVLALLSDRKALRSLDILLVSVAIGAFVLSTMGFADGLVMTLFGGAVALAVWRWLTWGSRDEPQRVAYFSLAGIALFVLGISVHLFMMIRAAQDPAINQSDPRTFDALMSVLRREQYPTRDIFVREALDGGWAGLWWQINHFWGSAVWQPGQSLAGSRAIGYLQQFTFLPDPGFLDRFLPLGLWLYGLFAQARGNWRLFGGFFTTLLVNSIGLILLLNFNDHEVRDRDYFYFGAYQFLALFLGLGAGALLRNVWLGLRDASWHRPVLLASCVLLVGIPMMPVLFAGAGEVGHPKWFQHDRSDNAIARNYGHNILAGLPPHAILCTNGDNDTFPLWYLQEVEGFRRDVRVVNLSLINLPWYLRQLRDLEPTLPIEWTDEQLHRKAPIRYKNWRTELVSQELPDGEIAWVRDMAIWHVLQNIRAAGEGRQLYYAVTVPNSNIGQWVPYMDMEGLVYRVTDTRSPDELPTINVEKIWQNFQQVYDLTGVVDEDGYPDSTIYRDHNTAHLLRNYPAALARIGYIEAVEKRHQYSEPALEMAYRMDPTFPILADVMPIVYLQLAQPDKAIEVARSFLGKVSDDIEMAIDLAEALITIDDIPRAVAWSEELVEWEPDNPVYVRLLYQAYALAERGDEAEAVLEDWIQRTGDSEARQELERYRRERTLQPLDESTP